MNMMRKLPSIAILLFVLISVACEHKAETPPACIAGTGGGVTIVVYADHQGTALPNYFTHLDTAFLKFGSTISPGTHPADYSIFFVSEPGEDHIHCMGLKCGDYFIYRTAWDSVANVSRYGGYGISFADTCGDKLVHVSVN
jgi:hypothetical protein